MRSVFFTSEFKRNIRQLAKKYRRIKTDLQPLLDALETGETPGNRIPNLGIMVYKVRAANSDAKKGKSGGYRIIYLVDNEQTIILVTIYSKTEQTDISVNEIAAMITTYEQEQRGQQNEERAKDSKENQNVDDEEK
jgi:mRNA-degrading endonuclease RelE of RelBE toxin-antitoxin system